MKFEIKGFHTCRAEGDKKILSSKVPFLSQSSAQWLGQGYYFWTGLAIWAEDWLGEQDKVISEFDISLPRDNVLDLVGSIEDQQDFKDIIDAFKKGHLFREYKRKFGDQFTVSKLISWLRDEKGRGFEDIFPYWAVRAKDGAAKRRVPFGGQHGEELFLLERHQMCVYAEYKENAVVFNQFVYPPHFMEECGTGVIA
ncbi:hypothetical protein V2J98_10655 [Pseudomonas alliivorans]|nr:hypothetical protein [Pseudomonas alliivorans]MEE4968868.1 hypothetical protein [Pseudomonas alliivorans]MEE4987458.1 hypothetical protein [Pseudomonas alliivorans]MEE4992498.1 hypothetical protein [Pseudomonas alliivorans]MEE5008098.1 hypothetical protein [Pseudomonas alliivorans]